MLKKSVLILASILLVFLITGESEVRALPISPTDSSGVWIAEFPWGTASSFASERIAKGTLGDTSGNTAIMEYRALFEFDLMNEVVSSNPVYFTFYLRNIDRPNYGTINLYAYEGNGVIEISDWYKTDTLITSFSDFGIVYDHPEYVAYSLDVTSSYNAFINNNTDYLGFLFLTNELLVARYDFGGGYPELYDLVFLQNEVIPQLPYDDPHNGNGSSPIPEPSTLSFMGIGLIGLAWLRYRRRN